MSIIRHNYYFRLKASDKSIIYKIASVRNKKSSVFKLRINIFDCSIKLLITRFFYNEYSSVINSVWMDTRNGEDVEETIEWAIEEYAAQTIKYKK